MQWKNPSRVDTKRTNISSRSGCYRSHSMLSCISHHCVWSRNVQHAICPRVYGREFDPLPSEEDTVSFLRELGHSGEINSLNDVVVDQMHQPWRTFDALINRSLFGKTSGLDKLRLSKA
ncbi:hypothetical protein Tco_0978952 [Tanacetum coccineum]|uniref:Uncharacterized protein n=1 Tax=Tanacetum coccineum TaxID=301880 RepID=A0ABQ5EPE1_9ASTR